MTKKAIHIVFSLLLIISTIGITVSKHYSNSELFSVAFWTNADSCCEIPCDCCSDETSYLYLDSDYLQTSTIEIKKAQVGEINLQNILLFVNAFVEPQKTLSTGYFYDSPPTYVSNLPAFLQVFRC